MAQTFMQVGALGSFNSTWLFNKNVSDKGDDQDFAAGWGHNFGLCYGFYFNENIGIEINGLIGLNSGAFTGVLDTNKTYNSEISYSSIDIPLMFKYVGKSGAYLEVGPQFSILGTFNYGFKQSYYDFNTGLNVNNDTSYAVTNFFKTSSIAAVLGFGINIKFTDALHLRTGLRFSYGLTDLKGVDALGVPFANFFSYKDGPLKTNAMAGGILIGLTYSIGKKKEDSKKE